MLASARVTATGPVVERPVSLSAVLLTAGGGEAASLVVRDGNGGPVVLTLKAPAGRVASFAPAAPVVLVRGLAVELSGSGAEATVAYL